MNVMVKKGNIKIHYIDRKLKRCINVFLYGENMKCCKKKLSSGTHIILVEKVTFSLLLLSLY